MWAPVEQFRRQVTEGACHVGALRGEQAVVVGPRQAEVSQASIELGIQHDVGCLHVAVDDAFLALCVQIHQRRGHIHNDLEPTTYDHQGPSDINSSPH